MSDNKKTYPVKILMSRFVTHDVKQFFLDKPSDYQFTPGQATYVSINQSDWKQKKHPFTFTSLNSDQVLEFTIKGYPVSDYPNHSGMTERLHQLEPGNELLIRDPWGTINYKGNGVFLAGGAGITPFIAIFRDLKAKNKIEGSRLIFSNKTQKDVIIEKELRAAFSKKDLLLTLTREEKPGYHSGRINEDLLESFVKDFSDNFYVSGPPAFVKDLTQILKDHGVQSENIVLEE